MKRIFAKIMENKEERWKKVQEAKQRDPWLESLGPSKTIEDQEKVLRLQKYSELTERWHNADLDSDEVRIQVTDEMGKVNKYLAEMSAIELKEEIQFGSKAKATSYLSPEIAKCLSDIDKAHEKIENILNERSKTPTG